MGEAAMQVLPWMERFAEKEATENKLDGMLDQMDFIFLDSRARSCKLETEQRALHHLPG